MSRTRIDQQAEGTLRARGRLLARALAILLAAAILAQFVHSAVARDAGDSAAPDFALKAASGVNLRLSEYRSEVVALAFWASWCGDCRDGLPMLERLQQSLGEQGLRVLAVSFDDKPDAAREIAAATGISFPVLLDAGGDVGRLYHIDDLPTVVLIDRAGAMRGVFRGEREVREGALAGDIRSLLAE